MRASSSASGLLVPSSVIGIGLSGFFDGILLHQVLQWHHLLSLVSGEQFRRISTQIFADGLFHVLMYAVTAGGLWLLWRRRDGLRSAAATATVTGGALLGFGGWNVADVTLFHWAMGIHRIRVNVDNPMAYDLAWLAALGILPLLCGFLILKRIRRFSSNGRLAGSLIAIVAVGSGGIASLPQPGQNNTLVLAAPDRSSAVLAAALASGARLSWFDREAGLILLAGGDEEMSAAMYDRGALFVTASSAFAGCAINSV
jgi:uncharacterized membrane protein